MPSPFPGMDPYLEEPGLWPDVHHRLISIAGDLLTDQLRPRYYARIEERVYITDEYDPGRRVIAPDLRIVKGQASPPRQEYAAVAADSSVATAEPLTATMTWQHEVREGRIEVIDRLERAVVTVIEILSPSNKVQGSRGRKSYDEKRHEVFSSPSHFVEIDLLRDGERFPPVETMPPYDYSVQVSPARRRPKGLVWPILLQQRLPVIKIPLKGDDPDASLDLQIVVATAYDRAGYDLELDYRTLPNPPLNPEQAAWADSLLKARGLR